MASSHHITHPRQVSVCSRRLCDVVLFRSSCLFEHTHTAVCAPLPSISLVVNIMYIRTFCHHLNVLYIFDQTDLYRVEVRLERPAVSPPSLSPSHPQALPPSRRPALITLPPLAKFQLVRHRLCGALLPSSSLAFPPHRPSSVSPLHPGGSGRVAKKAARTSFSFDFKFKMPTRLVHNVSTNAAKKLKMRNLRITYFHSIQVSDG